MTAGSSSGYYGNLRARGRDFSKKINSKSSRDIIYENEELRLKTMYINAEVEQGQNDIKKLRRDNRQLKREIWFLREEYKKLEDILESERVQKTEVFGEKLSSPTCCPYYSANSDQQIELPELLYLSQRHIENDKNQSHQLSNREFCYENTVDPYHHDCSRPALMRTKPSELDDKNYEENYLMKTSKPDCIRETKVLIPPSKTNHQSDIGTINIIFSDRRIIPTKKLIKSSQSFEELFKTYLESPAKRLSYSCYDLDKYSSCELLSPFRVVHGNSATRFDQTMENARRMLTDAPQCILTKLISAHGFERLQQKKEITTSKYTEPQVLKRSSSIDEKFQLPVITPFNEEIDQKSSNIMLNSEKVYHYLPIMTSMKNEFESLDHKNHSEYPMKNPQKLHENIPRDLHRKELKKNSVLRNLTIESIHLTKRDDKKENIPWCACWGNGCI